MALSKVVFLLLVVIVFIVAFYGIVQLIGYFNGPKKLLFINGQINASRPIIIPQNPANQNHN
jgi:hypothetical protein